ncbi:amidohydrolase family protein [Acinetobacter sp. WZC-1]|uniref:amidohydrolase family protein n=1 Tax=Acinetobacter sp. WZC-1 TaxID=3459034 RepID=UPI00403DF04A
MTTRTLITGAYLISMDQARSDIENGAVLIEDELIAAVGKATDFEHITDVQIIDARGNILMPGVIDSHRHTWMALLRAHSADMSLPEFLSQTFYGIGSIMEPEDIATATLVGALEAIDAGVTTIMDCCDCVNTLEHACRAVDSLIQSGIRGIYAYGFQSYDYKPCHFHAHSQRLDAARTLYEKYFSGQPSSLIQPGFLLSDFGTIPVDQTAREIRLARELGALIASHTGAAQNTILLKGLQELDDHGLLTPGHLHIHCTALTHPEWEILARTGAKVSIAPETEMQMGMGRPPFRACLDHGIQPGISTDIVCVGSGDLFSQMRLGLQFQRCMDHEATAENGLIPATIGLSVRNALEWATQGSAEALGLEKQIGSLTPGKKADLIILSHKALVRSCHPTGSAVLQTTAADVDSVMINGVFKKRHGKLLDIDLDEVRSQATQALDRIQQRARQLPAYSAEAVTQWFATAEHAARINFAQAYAMEKTE